MKKHSRGNFFFLQQKEDTLCASVYIKRTKKKQKNWTLLGFYKNQ